MPTVTKNNYKKYTRKNLLPDKDGGKPRGVVADKIFQQNLWLLDQFKKCYDSNQWLRDYCERCWRYYDGDQLSDVIDDPNGCGKITEREYLRQQGIVPQTMNIIRKEVKSVLGVYRSAHYEPLAIARDRDEQKLGEMMSLTMEYAYQSLNLPETTARGFEEILVQAITCFRIGFDKDDERKTSDVKVRQMEINRMAWDSNTSGLYFENITMIGCLHDFPLGKVLSTYATTKEERKKIEEIYSHCRQLYSSMNQQFSPETNRRNIEFFRPLDENQCRVIEIWSKEYKDSYEYHDIGRGITIYSDSDNDEDIRKENVRRVTEMVEAGGNAEDAALIEYVGYHTQEVWVARHLTPDGYVLKMEESPYDHGSHPFVIGAYPNVHGEIHSSVSDVIDIQRVYNITFMRNQYMRMNAAKGFGIVNLNILEKSEVSPQQFSNMYTSADGIIPLRWEAGEGNDVFVRFTDNTVNTADEHTMQICMDLVGKVFGTNGTLTGEKAKSGTPASLYAQETYNSNNNITDQIEWYNGLIQKRDYKIMQVIQQYYREKRFLAIAGKDYSGVSKYYDPEKVMNSQFDLAVVENQSQGIFRAQNENLLYALLQMGAIDPVTYLENSSAPFADKLLEKLKTRQEEQAAAEQAAQAQQAAQNGMIPQ